MSKARTVGKQAYFSFTGKFIMQTINLLITILLASSLKSNDYGIFSLGSTFIIFTYTIFNFGIENSIVYYISKYKAEKNENMVKKLLNTALFLRIITGIAGSIIIFMLSDIIESYYHINGLSEICKIFSFGYFGYSIIYIAPSIFQAFKKFKLSAKIDIFISLIKLILISLTLSYGLTAVSIGFNAALLISAAIMLFTFYKIAPKVKQTSFAFKTIIRYSAIVYAGTISTFIIGYIGNLLTGALPSEVSFLTIGNKIGMFIILPASSLGTALFPNISEMKNKDEIKKVYKLITKYTLLVTSFLSFFIISCGSKLIPLILGNSYANSELIINTIIIGYFLQSIFIPIKNLYNGIKKPHIITYGLIIQALISLTLSIILTPLFHGFGAAIAFATSNFIMALFLVYNAIKNKYGYNLSYLTKIAITSVASLSSILFNGIITKTLAFVTIFILTGFLTKSLKIYDIKLLIRIIQHKY